MTIQLITFVSVGQGFTWWEVDDETGRIVGCGPLEASVWASGKCSVDMASVKVGHRPVFHGPNTEPEGRTLRYEIESIERADTGPALSSAAPWWPFIWGGTP